MAEGRPAQDNRDLRIQWYFLQLLFPLSTPTKAIRQQKAPFLSTYLIATMPGSFRAPSQ